MTAKTAKELEDYVLEIPHGRREKLRRLIALQRRSIRP
jgi:hypothetical protein